VNYCTAIPFLVALIYYFIPDKLSTPRKLTLISWTTLALVMIIPCKGAFDPIVRSIESIAILVEREPALLAVLRIFSHNIIILALCALLGKAYLGFTVALTGIVAREIAKDYPLNVLLGAHTLLELYSYSLATTRRKRELIEAVAYLAVAALFEVIAIRF